MQYFVVITLAVTRSSGTVDQQTITGTPTVSPEMTRKQLFLSIFQQVPEHLRRGTVLFFSAEPNTLPGVSA
jgi:hypothetical protein